MATSGGRGRTKGGVLLARLRWVRDRGGDAAVERVLGMLGAEDQDVLRGQILHVSWYPLDLNLRLDDAIAEVFSPGDKRRVFIDMGRASADINLSGPHKAYVHAGDPQALLRSAPAIYKAYYDVGYRTYERVSDTCAVLRTFEAEDTTPGDCLTVVGWHERAIELCGGKNVKVTETKCRSAGADICEYRCEWR